MKIKILLHLQQYGSVIRSRFTYATSVFPHFSLLSLPSCVVYAYVYLCIRVWMREIVGLDLVLWGRKSLFNYLLLTSSIWMIRKTNRETVKQTLSVAFCSFLSNFLSWCICSDLPSTSFFYWFYVCLHHVSFVSSFFL